MGLRKYIENLTSDNVETDRLEVDGNQSNFGWREIGRLRNTDSISTESFDVDGEAFIRIEAWVNNQDDGEPLELTYNNNTNAIYDNILQNAGTQTTNTGQNSHVLFQTGGDQYSVFNGVWHIGLEWGGRNDREILIQGSAFGTSSDLSTTKDVLKFGSVESNDLGRYIDSIQISHGNYSESAIILYARDI
jgi:hypothetical protein